MSESSWVLERFPTVPDELTTFLEWMRGLDDNDRHRAIMTIGDEFCLGCGRDKVPCSCWNDE